MKKLIGLAVLAALLALGAAWFVLSNRLADAGQAAAQPAKQAATQPATASDAPTPDVIRYAGGAPQLAMVQSQLIAASPVPLTDALSARLAYYEDVTSRVAVGVAGRITAIKAAPGDTVKAGQVLAEIDSPDFGSASADLAKARADEDRKRQAVERARALGPGDAISLKDWESLQADQAQAVAETLRAKQRLSNLDPLGLVVAGQRMKLVSPMAGVVAERTATPALEVNTGLAAPLFVVTDPRKLWLLIDLPETLLSRIQRGRLVEVDSDAYPAEHFKARIVQVGAVVDSNTRRVTVRARLDNAQLKLLPEMFVRARILQDNGSGVQVPNSAIVNQGAYNHVFVQTAAGEFQRRRVSLLTQGSDASYVGAGLQGNERIVTTGALLLDAELTARTAQQP
jgi:cobalt-zinc-cadmium efflux system membrane fusion protein